jgi:hypothetical protein
VKTLEEQIIEAKAHFYEVAYECGSDPVTEENAILSIGQDLLPPCALAVLADRDADSVEYWEFLAEQTEIAQAEHDAAYAAEILP